MSTDEDANIEVILLGIAGSRAYGLDRPGSDTDVKGIFVAPVRDVLGLDWSQNNETRDSTNPDICLHEVSKFFRLALAANPTCLELLYLEQYEKLTHVGAELVARRDIFLSQRVTASYGGYAMAQLKRLQRRDDGSFSSNTRNRYAKHARHMFRLLLQGRQLLEEGTLTVRVADPDALFAIGELPPEALAERFEKEYEQFLGAAARSKLPLLPDRTAANELLLRIRGV